MVINFGFLSVDGEVFWDVVLQFEFDRVNVVLNVTPRDDSKAKNDVRR